MKKSLTAFALPLAFAASAFAQYQVGNSDFELWDDTPEPLNWNSYATATGVYASAVNSDGQLSRSTDTRDGSSGSYSAYITSATSFGVVAQGNLTTGRVNVGSMKPTAAKSNYNFTDVGDTAFNATFTGLPDAVTVWVKYRGASSSHPYGKVSALLHANGYFQDPWYNQNDIVDLVASATDSTETTFSLDGDSSWIQLSIPFSYASSWDGTRPAYALVTFATNTYPGGSDITDYMYIDDLEFVYNSGLDSVTYDGKSYLKSGSSVSIDEDYDSGLLSVYTNGVGATYETSYDEATYALTVTVKGDNISEDPSNYHVYTLKFSGTSSTTTVVKAAPATIGEVSSVSEVASVSEEVATASDDAVAVVIRKGAELVTLSSESAAPGDTVTLTPVEGVTVYAVSVIDVVYGVQYYLMYYSPVTENDDGSFSFTMMSEFTEVFVLGAASEVEESKSYEDYLMVTLAFLDNSYIENADPVSSKINLDIMKDGSYSFTLDNFAFSMLNFNVGRIVITGIEPVVEDDGAISFTATDSIVMAEGSDNSWVDITTWTAWYFAMIYYNVFNYNVVSVEGGECNTGVVDQYGYGEYDEYLDGCVEELGVTSFDGDEGLIPISLSGKIIDEKLYLDIDIYLGEGFGYNAYVSFGAYAIALAEGSEDYITVSSGVSSDSTVAGDTVKVTPVEGASIASIFAITESGVVTTLEAYDDDTYYFVMPAEAVTIEASTTLKYAVSLSEGTSDYVSVSAHFAAEGDTVTISVNELVTLSALSVVTADSEEVEVTDYSFIMPAEAVTITATGTVATVVASYSFYDYLMVTVNDVATEPSAITVYLDSLSDGTYYFKLNNFVLISEGVEAPVGNIVLSGLEPVEGDDGSITFSVNESITIAAGDDESVETWLGPMLGEVPLELTGTKTASGKLYFHIDIDMTGSLGQIIAVEFGTYQIAVAEGAEDLVSFSARSGVDSTTVGDTVYVTLADGVDADSVTITAGNSTFSLAGTTTIEEVSGEDTAEVEVYYFIMPEAAVTITATASETEDGTGSSSSESTGSSSSESTGSSSSGTPIIASNAAKAQNVSLYMNARTLNVTAPAGSKLYLFDLTGHTVAVKTLAANTAVSLEGLPAGNLFAVVTSEQGSRLASKRISLK